MHIDHINISGAYAFTRRSKSLLLFCIGFVVGNRPNFSRRGFWLCSEGQALIHLSENNTGIIPGAQNCLDHVSIQTAGLNQFITRLEDLNIDYSAIYNSERDMTQVFFRDPAQVKIEAGFVGEQR